MLVCTVVLWQSSWRTKMQYPVALFQKRSKIRNFGTKCLFMISAGCLFPTSSIHRLFVSWKKNCSLSALLRAEQRTAVLKSLSQRQISPQLHPSPAHSPGPHLYLWQFSMIPRFCGVLCCVFLLAAFPPRWPKWSQEHSRAWTGKDEATEDITPSLHLCPAGLCCTALPVCIRLWAYIIYFFLNAAKVWFPKQFLAWKFALSYWLTHVFEKHSFC